MIDARNGITMTTQQQQRDVVEEIYKDDVNEAKGIDIGVPGVRFYKLPHKVSGCPDVSLCVPRGSFCFCFLDVLRLC